MSSVQHVNSSHDGPSTRPARPAFSSSKTSDRLRECERRIAIPMSISGSKPRRSRFKEDLDGSEDLGTVSRFENQDIPNSYASASRSRRQNETFDDILKNIEPNAEPLSKKRDSSTWYTKITNSKRPQIRHSATAPPSTFSSISRLSLIIVLIALVVPGFRYSSGKDKVNISGADAGVITSAELVDNARVIEGRQDANSPTDICTRWSHMTANINGTLYIYGGQATAESGQTSNTWNNNFLALDLTKSWEVSSPSLTGLPQPSGPPAIALGSLWHSYTSLFVYGGEFSDSPPASPLPVSTWEYIVSSSRWTEHSNLQTSAGNNSDGGNQPIQRAAEGAGLSVPEIGRSWYFGGHLDMYTTEGWSNQIARIYLKSLLEFTHPGYANSGVESLQGSNPGPSDGVYRNITQGGLQDSAGFTERADGVLVYVPGWGDEGIILGLAGGTNETFTEMNIIDVFDIATSTWYKQSTSGTSPPIRVDPCAVVAAAADGSSFNIYLYGGQNLIPYGSQTQYSDMWILTVPSFTWIQIDLTGQSQPPARAGHTCNLYDGQIVVVGGYVGPNISCDSPGVYVFNASSLRWSNSFTASSPSDLASFMNSTVLQDSYGYEVPAVVQSIVGGNSLGGATVTTPAAGSATNGPLATGRALTWTVTQPGSTVTQSSQSTATVSSSPDSSNKSSGAKSGGTIAAGVVAGLLACLAAYLAFCTWLYRRQLHVYQNHVAMAQRSSFAEARESWSNRGNEMRMGNSPTEHLSGPFGTVLGTRSSQGSSPYQPSPREESVQTPVSANEHTKGKFFFGGGTMPGAKYGRLSEETAYTPAGMNATAHSSTDDLLGGQEPSFFNVVMNPRRTLRIVNSD